MEIKSTLSYEDWRNSLKKTAAIVAGSLALTGSLVACESNSEIEAKPNTPVSQSDGGGAEVAPSDNSDEAAPSSDETVEAESPSSNAPESSIEETTSAPDSLPKLVENADDYPSVLSPEELAELKKNSYGGTFTEYINEYRPTPQEFKGAISLEDLAAMTDQEIMELAEEGVCLPGWENCTVEQFGQQLPEKLQNRFNAMDEESKQLVMSKVAGDPKYPDIEFELRVTEGDAFEQSDGSYIFQFYYPTQWYSTNEGIWHNGFYDQN